jgi:hypothetical protein
MINAIETNVNLWKPIDVPIIRVDSSGAGDGIAFMLTPIGQETRYMDGSVLRNYAFQISARSQDQLQVLNALLEINKYVDSLRQGDIVSTNGSFEFVSAVVASVPNLVNVDNYGFLYVSNFQSEILLIEN